jgi:hypothetical protein
MKIDNVYKRSIYSLFCIHFQICNISQILQKKLFLPKFKKLRFLNILFSSFLLTSSNAELNSYTL